MKDKNETYIIDDFQYDLKKMIEKIKETAKKMEKAKKSYEEFYEMVGY